MGTARAQAAQQMGWSDRCTSSGWDPNQALVAVCSPTRASFRWLGSPWGLCLPGDLGLAQVVVEVLYLWHCSASGPSRVNPSISLALTSVAWDAITLFCSMKGQQRFGSETFAWVSCFGVTLSVCSHSCDPDHCAARPGLWEWCCQPGKGDAFHSPGVVISAMFYQV